MQRVPQDGLVLQPRVIPSYVAEFQTQSEVDFLQPGLHEHNLSVKGLPDYYRPMQSMQSDWFAQTGRLITILTSMK